MGSAPRRLSEWLKVVLADANGGGWLAGWYYRDKVPSRFSEPRPTHINFGPQLYDDAVVLECTGLLAQCAPACTAATTRAH